MATKTKTSSGLWGYVGAVAVSAVLATQVGAPPLLALAAIPAWYVIQVALYPTTTCRKQCGGRVWDAAGKNWRDCSTCGGSGKRTRPLARIWRGK